MFYQICRGITWKNISKIKKGTSLRYLNEEIKNIDVRWNMEKYIMTGLLLAGMTFFIIGIIFGLGIGLYMII